MIKKLALLIIITIAFVSNVEAGVVIVGKNKILTIQENSNSPSKQKESPIIISPLEGSYSNIKLVPIEEFLAPSEEVSEEVVEETVKVPVVEVVEAPIEETVVETKESPEDIIKTAEEVSEKVQNVEADDIYIAYESDKKTLLSEDARSFLRELVSEAEKENKKLAIISYAAGEPSMARRVALIRANVITTTLKEFGVADENIEIQSFGNQVNINQSRVFLVK